MLERMLPDQAEELSAELRTADEVRDEVRSLTGKDPLTTLKTTVDKVQSGELTPEDVQELSNVMLAYAVKLQQDREKAKKESGGNGHHTGHTNKVNKFFDEEGLNFFGE